MRQRSRITAGIILTVAGLFFVARSQESGDGKTVSFQKDITPIIQRACIPCHAEESMNPSGLSLDSYDGLIAGGKHGTPVTPGKPDESLLIKKLGPNPPFGDRMPLQRRKSSDDSKRKVTEEEIQLIKAWISQGAKKN